MPNPTPAWITEAIASWTASKTKLQPGVSIDTIREAEKVLQFSFPQDFIDLYTVVNGFEDWDWNEHMFSLWSIERILAENRQTQAAEDIIFCDFLIFSHTFSFTKTTRAIRKNYDIINKNGKQVIVPFTKNFCELIWMINNNHAEAY